MPSFCSKLESSIKVMQGQKWPKIYKNLYFSRLISDTRGWGAPHPGPPKKIQKMRFFKSCDTLTTIQLGEKTQLTKVVSALKRFGDPVQARWDNRVFWLFWRPPPPGGLQKAVWGWFLRQKLRLSQRACTGSPNLFRAETTLVSCVFSHSWIVVKVS